MKRRLILLLLMIAPLSYASEVVVLKDGRKVQLNDNFTWQYVQTDSQKKQETKPASAVPTIPVIKQQPSSSLTILGANKPTLQLEKSGVDVLLGALQYQSGKLIIPTSITNQGTESVILVTLDITITDAQGNVLTTQTVNVWESIKRLADTYLRPQSQSEGRTISLDVNKLKQYKISAAITQVVTR